MIIATNIETAHTFGDIMPSMYRLRHQSFKVRQSYDVPSYRGMEYDSYDTPATTYLIWRDADNQVRGCTRLFPTTLPYMIEEIWPDAVQTCSVPKHPRIWECSRYCIDKNLSPELRQRIHGELLCGFLEFGLKYDIDWMIGVMMRPIWRAVFIRAGWPIEFLGGEKEVGNKEKIYVGRMDIREEILTAVRQKFGIHTPVLLDGYDLNERKAA